MSAVASDTAHQRPRSRAVLPPEIREHRIPTEGSKPYIAMEGFDGCLWFCESGASRIGRFDPVRASFTEFELPTPNATPIGITVGGDGNYWFCEKTGNKIGRLTPRGEITEFPLPTPNASPDGCLLGPDGNVWFSETEVSRIGRITPDGRITEFKDGITPGSKPLSLCATARCGSARPPATPSAASRWTAR
jgi:virginiamycin B lyase